MPIDEKKFNKTISLILISLAVIIVAWFFVTPHLAWSRARYVQSY